VIGRAGHRLSGAAATLHAQLFVIKGDEENRHIAHLVHVEGAEKADTGPGQYRDTGNLYKNRELLGWKTQMWRLYGIETYVHGARHLFISQASPDRLYQSDMRSPMLSVEPLGVGKVPRSRYVLPDVAGVACMG
jgi:hypothetical protein